MQPDSALAKRICDILSQGENIVQIIHSMNLPILETLDMMALFEGEQMAAYKKVPRRHSRENQDDLR